MAGAGRRVGGGGVPPIASTAMVTMLGRWLLLLDFHYFAALVLSAVRANAMRQLGLMTVGAFGHPGSFQRIMRTAILGPPRRVASFRIRHFSTDLKSVGVGATPKV